MFDSRTTKRLTILARIIFAWAAIILCRLVYLQVISHDDLKRLAQQQQQKMVDIEASRGAIFDRAGQPLAMSLPVDSVCINPLRVPDASMAADILAGVLNLDAGELLVKIKNAVNNRNGFLWVKRRVTRRESERLRRMNLDWIEFRTDTKRFYPNGSLAAHILGGVDFAEKGNGGIELSLNGELQGRAGLARMFTDVKQNAYADMVARKPQPGENIVLTIDSRIQFVAERELKAAVEKAHATTGSVVAMNPRTGEILALANYPTFDPNQPPAPGESLAPRNDLAVSTPFEPGSVFKVITLSSALETTNIRPDTIIPCGNGVINLFGRVIHDHNSYSALSMADVLAKSSNIGAIQIGLRVGQDRLYEYVRRFGFGQDTGITLPAESTGLLRKLPHWGKTSIGSVAMGHEVSVTTVQLAQACSVIANGGLLLKPQLVLRRSGENEPRLVKASYSRGNEVRAEVIRRVLQPETTITMRQMMEGVVLHGTGTKARLTGYTSGGKTGSAQIFDFATHQYTHHYNGSFMGFAPVANPAIVIVVTLNGTSGGTAGYGGAVAAPVFREVATAALRILDVPKDLPDNVVLADKKPVDLDDLAIAELSPNPGLDSGDSRVSSVNLPPVPPAPEASASGADTDRRTFLTPVAAAANQLTGPKVPNFQGKTMRAVLEESAAIGMPVEVLGTGIARGQEPPPGTILPPGQTVRVQFAR